MHCTESGAGDVVLLKNQEIMSTGAIPFKLFVQSKKCSAETVSYLDQKLVIWSFNRALNRCLTSTAIVRNLTPNYVDEGRTVEAFTASTGYLDTCWTTGALEKDATLSVTECRSGFGILMPFTTRELIEPLQTELK